MKGGSHNEDLYLVHDFGFPLTGYFSYEACMALEELFERLEEEEGASYQAPALGDIIVSFAEVKEEDIDESTFVIAELSDGNVLIMNE